MLLGIDEMCVDMIFHDLGHETGHGSSHPRNEMQDLLASSFAVERTFDAFNLATNATHPRQQFMFFADCVAHSCCMA